MENQAYLTEPFTNYQERDQQQIKERNKYKKQSSYPKFKLFQPNGSQQSNININNNNNSVTNSLYRSQSQNKRNQSGQKREKKILNIPFPNQYYYESKKIKPGLNIYKTILETQERRIDCEYTGPQLNFPIPDTFIYYDNTYYLIGYNYEKQKLEIQKNLNYMQFLQYFRKITENGVIKPIGVTLTGSGITVDKTIVMSNDVSLKNFPKNQSQIISKYIMPYRLFPNKLRLFYYPKGTKIIKRNYAYKIVNKNQMSKQLFKRKYKLEHQFFVVTQKEELLNINIMHGRSIQTCQNMAQNLIQYLQKSKNIKIFEIVIDFCVDQNKMIWFSQLKSIKSKNLTTMWQIGNDQQMQVIANDKNSLILCELCQIKFQKNQIKRLVTNKLIYQLVTHLNVRGIDISFSKNKNKIDGHANVCQLCYELIVAEHKLIDIQRQFSKIMNIGQNSIQRVPFTNFTNTASFSILKTSNLKTHQNQTSLLPNEQNNQVQINIQKVVLTSKSTLLQWRMIIFIHKVKNIKNIAYQSGNLLKIQMDIKGGRLKDKFKKTIDNSNSHIDGMTNTRFKSSNVSQERKIQNVNLFANQNFNHLSQSNTKTNSTAPSRATVNYNNFIKIPQRTNNQRLSNCCQGFERSANFNIGTNNMTNSLWKDNATQACSRATTAKNKTNYLTNPNEYNVSLIDDERLSCSVQRVKIYNFYSTTQDISKFLENAKINFSMKYANQKFTGDTSTLQAFHNKTTCQRHSSQVFMFDSGLKYCNMELTTGLICDGYVNNVKPELLDYSVQDNLFYPKKNSLNSLKLKPLPQQWMEVFADGKIPYSFEPVESITLQMTKFKESIGNDKNFFNKVKSLERLIL